VTTTVDLPVPSSALAVAAHPDDVEFGCGGTLAKWAAEGCVVHHLICTDGSKGTWDPDADIDALRRTRQEEQRAAAAALGATGEQLFMGWVDGELESGLAERGEVARAIRALRPQVVLGHDPWKRYRLHPDHRHAGFLAVEGVVGARDPFFFREHGLAPHRPETILLWEATRSTTSRTSRPPSTARSPRCSSTAASSSPPTTSPTPTTRSRSPASAGGWTASTPRWAKGPASAGARRSSGSDNGRSAGGCVR
jgi:LmbE family N-acetylglucosaminyl deacetylase